MIKKVFLGLVVLVLIIICFFIFSKEEKEELVKIKPSIQDLKISVEAVGKVYTDSLVEVATLANGEIKDFRVKLGDKLKKGDIIAILDDETEKNQLASEESKLVNLLDEKNSANVSLEEAKNKFTSQETLYNKGASSKDSYLSAKSNYYAAIAKLSSIEASIKQTKANIASYKNNLDLTVVKAPIDGVVISVYASLGQTINSRTSSPTLIKMANLDELKVKMQIPQNDVAKLKAGQVVEYIPLSDGAVKKSTYLSSVDDADVTVVANSSTDGAVYYYARFDAYNDKDLKIGMDVQNTIIIQDIKDALTIPINYLSKDKGGYYVNIADLSEQGYKKSYVKLGLSDDFNIQILSGLNKDDEIVLLNKSLGASNDKVKMR
ncbi:efflux RND transporter periplasmic adaptor subunit [Campylobacter canadensis]|uniref:Efflux RND transporter periplasmic adaptor subunit n=1 Tax=Campylobacter canadensis TaxID=449520 RepID=A0ABS7WQ98_9BACT|nr:efflux RND transporter periplasmic adaptor subunit [Campylobacter canadensis]MBZ7986943.1 efflux RND transporter periplasmic adaptor subunit [Campylobacter canadensis]MBZ7994262.1 efflux RND transporter periplasmic adaptor subunit [Campylobacter canadensis]MBZ7995746.1 efflux RND transporter periplasmic adaptor subunit [Campylobacter canadensis]MBZ7997979.1 efflux RND transporter periplasmic adaptor subunit [Campylobacter canadensis]MBZ7999594.1 efflux RND transporter periplasmic adaptor su